MHDIMNRLDNSLGAASQELKLLVGLGAVKAVYFPGDRRDHFAADLELSKFATVRRASARFASGNGLRKAKDAAVGA